MSNAASVTGAVEARTAGYSNKAEVLESVREYYGEILFGTDYL